MSTRHWVRHRCQFRVWHLAMLNLFVAVAIVNILDQRRGEPALVALASAGFVAYGALGLIGWGATRHLEDRLGRVARLAVFHVAMAGLFLIATLVYLEIESAYFSGRLWSGATAFELLRSSLRA